LREVYHAREEGIDLLEAIPWSHIDEKEGTFQP
jgi:hypothetical protein